jgi:Protein of unknown function (DUF2752)
VDKEPRPALTIPDVESLPEAEVLDLQPGPVPAMVRPPMRIHEPWQQPLPVIPILGGWVRFVLVLIAVLLSGVFTIAVLLNPYRDGRALTMETHRQLGLPPCTFKKVTGLPCPSCGMTTSFALLMHGDLVNSLRANAVGTLLALVCLAYIPWALLCAVRGRRYLILSFEHVLIRLVVLFLVLMLARWAIVLLV